MRARFASTAMGGGPQEPLSPSTPPSFSLPLGPESPGPKSTLSLVPENWKRQSDAPGRKTRRSARPSPAGSGRAGRWHFQTAGQDAPPGARLGGLRAELADLEQCWVGQGCGGWGSRCSVWGNWGSPSHSQLTGPGRITAGTLLAPTWPHGTDEEKDPGVRLAPSTASTL